MKVDSNIETKANNIEYLKSIDVNANNIHDEYEFDNYIVSIVMVSVNSTTINSSDEDYEVYSEELQKLSDVLLRMEVKNYNDENKNSLIQWNFLSIKEIIVKKKKKKEIIKNYIIDL